MECLTATNNKKRKYEEKPGKIVTLKFQMISKISNNVKYLNRFDLVGNSA